VAQIKKKEIRRAILDAAYKLFSKQGYSDTNIANIARILSEASVTLPLLGGCVTEDAMVASPEVAPRIRSAMASLVRALDAGGGPGPTFPLD